MCDQTEVKYSDGDVVWVKLGSCWWPGEVCGFDKLPPDFLKSFRKLPIAVVKFFQEDSFEYVKNINFIYNYNCSKKHEFIKKGLDLYRSNLSHMEKFPGDVSTAEQRTNGNPDIISSKEFLPQKKESYANIFGTPEQNIKKEPGKRGRKGKGKWNTSNTSTPSKDTPKITHSRILKKYATGTSDYKAHILLQPTKAPTLDPDSSEETSEIQSPIIMTPKSVTNFSPSKSTDAYNCYKCGFSTSRLNVMVLHHKSHDTSPVISTPVKRFKTKSPTFLKNKSKSATVSTNKEAMSPSSATSKKKRLNVTFEAKSRKPKSSLDSVTPLKSQNSDLSLITPPKRKLSKLKDKEAKKPKTDEEIKNSLLADWNEDSDDDSMNVLTSLNLTENQPDRKSTESKPDKKDEDKLIVKSNVDKVESKLGKRDQASCFDFEEDEDLQIEHISRKIPRLSKSEDISKKLEEVVKTETLLESTNVSDKIESKVQDDTVDLDFQINNLLKETIVPDLPALPSDSNFQKNKITKPPDKDSVVKSGETQQQQSQQQQQPSKSIFKTKTFFRSRHSRSQDAIEKYVADNASIDKPPTYMEETIDTDKSNDHSSDSLNDIDRKVESSGDDSSKPERVTKFAPKIQLKKMNAALSKNKSQEDLIDNNRLLKDEDKDAQVIKKDKPSESDLQIAETLMNLPSLSDKSSETNKNEQNRPETNLSKNIQPISEKKDGDNENASKLYQLLDDSNKPKPKSPLKIISTKIIKPQQPQLLQGKEKILNFNVGASQTKSANIKKQNIIIRRSTASIKTDELDSEVFSDSVQDNLILKNTGKWDADVQTFTIESGSGNDDLLDPQIKKIGISSNAFPTKQQQNFVTKPHNTIITSKGEIIQSGNKNEESFDINTMPIVFNEILDNKNKIEAKLTSTKAATEPVKKSIVVKAIVEKTASPNILSKSNKTKMMKQIYIDKNTGEKKYIIHGDSSEIMKISPKTLIDKKGQKIILNQKGQVLSGDTKTIVQKIVQSKPESSTSGNTFMIIRNAHGEQSKIMLTPEHQKILFPKGKPSNAQIIVTSKPSSTITSITKPKVSQMVVSTQSMHLINSDLSNKSSPMMTKTKGTIINSKGQIIMSPNSNKMTILTTMPGQAILTSKGHLITPTSNVITSTSKLTTINRTTAAALSQPSLQKFTSSQTVLIKQGVKIREHTGKSMLLAQKSGTAMHCLTPAEFEHFKKTGEIISSSSSHKIIPGKVTQKYIVQKCVRPKDVIDSNVEMQQSKSEVVYKTATPIQSESVLTNVKQNEKIDKMDNASLLEADDANNLDKLIPASIIPTRKNAHKELCQDAKANVTKENINKDSDKPIDGNVGNQGLNSLNDPQKQLLAVPGENFGGPPNSFFLCVEENGTLTPVDNQPLILENNQLVPMTMVSSLNQESNTSNVEIQKTAQEANQQQQQQVLEIPLDQAQQNILINIGDQQILVDQPTLLSLLAGDGQPLVMDNGQQLVFQGGTQQILAALASNPELAGLLSGGQVLLNSNQTVASEQMLSFPTDVQQNQDILAAALAGTEVFQQDMIPETVNIATTGAEGILMDIDSLSPNIHNQNIHVSNVYETSSTLNQPIMSPLEIPTKKRSVDKAAETGLLAISKGHIIQKNLDDSLADIGVTTANIPTSLELPITVTNPRIAVKTTSPLSLTCTSVYPPLGLVNSMVSPTLFETETNYNLNITNKNKEEEQIQQQVVEENKDNTQLEITETIAVASSMPCLDDESSESFQIEKQDERKTFSPISMPILTDDVDTQNGDEIEASECIPEVTQKEDSSAIVEITETQKNDVELKNAEGTEKMVYEIVDSRENLIVESLQVVSEVQEVLEGKNEIILADAQSTEEVHKKIDDTIEEESITPEEINNKKIDDTIEDKSMPEIITPEEINNKKIDDTIEDESMTEIITTEGDNKKLDDNINEESTPEIISNEDINEKLDDKIDEESMHEIISTEDVNEKLDDKIDEELMPEIISTEDVNEKLDDKLDEESMPEIISIEDVNEKLDDKIDEESMPEIISIEDVNEKLDDKNDEESMPEIISNEDINENLGDKIDEESMPEIISTEDVNEKLGDKIDEELMPEIISNEDIDEKLNDKIYEESISEIISSEDVNEKLDDKIEDESIPELISTEDGESVPEIMTNDVDEKLDDTIEDESMPEVMAATTTITEDIEEHPVSSIDEKEDLISTSEDIINQNNEEVDGTLDTEFNRVVSTADDEINNELEDDICADTPPTMSEPESSMLYDDEPFPRSEAEGNSLPDHEDLNVSCSSESAALPDSTSPNLEMKESTPEASQDMFSESSNDSTEIPIQPVISISQHTVQNFSSLLNNIEGEKSDQAEAEHFDSNGKKSPGDVDER